MSNKYALAQWEFSNVNTGITYDIIPAGWRNIKITDAGYDDSTTRYFLRIKDLSTKIETTIGYNLQRADENGNLIYNSYSLGTLGSLGKALFDMNEGVPAPADVIGGVVRAEVKHNVSKTNGRTYLNIYTYRVADDDTVLDNTDIDQESVPLSDIPEKERAE